MITTVSPVNSQPPADIDLVALTGADQVLGLQVAKKLAENGHTALVGSRNLEKQETAATSIRAHAHAHALLLDVTDPASIAAGAERIRTDTLPQRSLDR